MNGGYRRLLPVAKRIYVVLVAAFLVWAVWRAGGQLQDWAGWLLEPAAYGFVLCWMLMALLLGAGWARVLSLYLGLQLRPAEWLPIQGVAWAGRYLPGKVGLMAGKLVLLERPGVELKPLAFSVLFEQLAFVVVGSTLALLLSPPLSAFQFQWLQMLGVVDNAWWRWGAGILIIVAFFPLIHLFAARLRVARRVTVWQAAALCGYYLFAHAVAGLGLYFILQALPADVTPSLAYAIGLLAVANVAGIVAVFAPAGIGVREFVLTLGLSPFLSLEEALALSAILRLLTVIADLVFSAAVGGGRLLTIFGGRR